MKTVGTQYGGTFTAKKFKISSTFSTAGVPTAQGGATSAGIAPGTTTTATNTVGVTIDTATYTTTQSSTMTEGIITVYTRPDAIYRALMSGGAANGTALTVLTNTTASSGGTVVTDASNVSANSFVGGTIICIFGANVGVSRKITSNVASTSITVTVPFPNAIAKNDQFIAVPWAPEPTSGASAFSAMQGTTNVDQADASIATGTGIPVIIWNLNFDTSTTTLAKSGSTVDFFLDKNIYGS